MKQWRDTYIDTPQHAVLELHRPTHQRYCNARCHKGGEYGSWFKLKPIWLIAHSAYSPLYSPSLLSPPPVHFSHTLWTQWLTCWHFRISSRWWPQWRRCLEPWRPWMTSTSPPPSVCLRNWAACCWVSTTSRITRSSWRLPSWARSTKVDTRCKCLQK